MLGEQSVDGSIDRQRVLLFLGVAFGIAWAVALVIHFTGGLRESPVLVEGTQLTLALVLLTTGYMWSPAVAHAVTRTVTGEGWDLDRTFLRPRLHAGWACWAIAWLGPVGLTVVGTAAFFVGFPDKFGSFSPAGAAGPLGGQSWVLTLFGVLGVAVAFNTVFAFGEEFGWRAYLLPKLMPLGGRRAVLLVGVIWGIWHWPAIAMGHNYGFGYPGAPVTGMLAMVWFTVVVGTFLAWVTLRGGSVWPAAIGHGAVNATAGLGLLFAANQPNPLLGPAPTGVIASVGWASAAALILIIPGAIPSRG